MCFSSLLLDIMYVFSFEIWLSVHADLALLGFCYKFQKPDDEETEILNHEEDFCLPQSFFVKEES